MNGHTLGSFKHLVAEAWKPRRPESPLEWLPKHIRFPDGWESRRFSFEDAPHARGVITRGVLNPRVRKIVLVWATRLTKTTLLESLAAWKAVQDPAPMAALFPDNEQLDQVDDHLFPFLECCAPVAAQLPPPHARNRKAIRLSHCRIRLASGGKKSSVSGYPAKWVFKFEHDKLSRRRSSEADPSARIDSRTSGFRRGVKIFEEGTPAKKADSRAAAAMESPDNQQATFHVQCPMCGKFQSLTHDRLGWAKNEAGRSEPQLAARTAYYECVRGCRIESHQRRAMMNTGQWVIEGETIDDSGTISGTPVVDSDTIVFGPLSKLYSLLISGWGVIAAELVRAWHAYNNGDDSLIEKCYSETLAIPWDPHRRTVRTNDLAKRLSNPDHPERGHIPAWASFLTFTADVGMVADELVFYWMVCAWGGTARGGVVDWGVSHGRNEFLKEWRALEYPLDGQNIKVWGHPACVDSGTYTADICAMVRGIKNCFPSKGDSRAGRSNEYYQPGFQRAGLSPREVELKRKAGAYDLLWISTAVTQQWRVALVGGRLRPEIPGFVSLPLDVCEAWEEHEEFLEELTADQLIDGRWIGENNEWGDVLRYARALAECYTGNGRRWGRLPLLSKVGHGGPRVFSRQGTKRSGNGGRFIQGFDR